MNHNVICGSDIDGGGKGGGGAEVADVEDEPEEGNRDGDEAVNAGSDHHLPASNNRS